MHGIAKIFRKYIIDANSQTSDQSYRSASSMLKEFDFTLRDVSAFAGLLSGEHFSSKANYWTAGLFISAAINKIIKNDDLVTLDFQGLESPTDCVGYGLEKGSIEFRGDAGDYLGEGMSGGSITIMGDAGNYVGYNMSGGEITVEGNAGEHVGTYMSGGTIRISGSMGTIPASCRGSVYHRGKLLR